MRYQEIDFVVDYARFDEQGFSLLKSSKMSWLLFVSKSHPRIQLCHGRAAKKNAMLSYLVYMDNTAFQSKHTATLDVQAYYEGTSKQCFNNSGSV